jgi:pimeloyl-ACP methyl ester carboxylesterase
MGSPDWDSGRLPVFVRDRIWTMILQQDYNSDEYGAIATDMYQLFFIRMWPFPSCVMDSITGKNPHIAVGLFGPASDFALQGGSMAQFNITADLHKIAVPVLLTEGGYDYDIVRPVVVDVLEQNIPHTERITLSTTGHVSVVDAPGDMNNAMADFFRRVESNIFVSKHNNSASGKSVFGTAIWLHAISMAVLVALGVAIGRKWGTRHDYTHIS